MEKVCVLAAVTVEAVMLLVQGSGMLWSVVVVAGLRKKIRQSARCMATSYCTQFLPSK